MRERTSELAQCLIFWSMHGSGLYLSRSPHMSCGVGVMCYHLAVANVDYW